jgi:hypothetical protein
MEHGILMYDSVWAGQTEPKVAFCFAPWFLAHGRQQDTVALSALLLRFPWSSQTRQRSMYLCSMVVVAAAQGLASAVWVIHTGLGEARAAVSMSVGPLRNRLAMICTGPDHSSNTIGGTWGCIIPLLALQDIAGLLATSRRLLLLPPMHSMRTQLTNQHDFDRRCTQARAQEPA